MIAGADRWKNSRIGKKSLYIGYMKTVSHLLAPDSKEMLYLRGNGNQLTVKTIVQELNSSREFEAKALLDSGCTGCAIDKEFIEKNHLKTVTLERPVTIHNADGTENMA